MRARRKEGRGESVIQSSAEVEEDGIVVAAVPGARSRGACRRGSSNSSYFWCSHGIVLRQEELQLVHAPLVGRGRRSDDHDVEVAGILLAWRRRDARGWLREQALRLLDAARDRERFGGKKAGTRRRASTEGVSNRHRGRGGATSRGGRSPPGRETPRPSPERREKREGRKEGGSGRGTRGEITRTGRERGRMEGGVNERQEGRARSP